MNKGRNNKKLIFRIAYIAIFACFILYMLFAPYIVVKVSGHNDDIYGISELPDIWDKEYYYSVDRVHKVNDIYQSQIIVGWAFIFDKDAEQEHTNENRKIELIFHGQKASYSVPAVLLERFDVRNAIADYPQTYGDNNGYRCDFSTLIMKPGIYDLYINVYENDDIQGMFKTDNTYIVDGKGMYVYNEN